MWPFSSSKSHFTYLSIPGTIRVTLAEAKYFSARDFNKLIDALCVLSVVVNSDAFRKAVESRDYSSTEDSGHEVFDKILHAQEVGTDDDREIDFSLQYYNSWWSKVIGYGLPRSAWIFLNWKYHLNFKPWQTAANLAHEEMHKLGYGHSSATDYKSAPYAIGFITEVLGEKMYDDAMKLRATVEMLVR